VIGRRQTTGLLVLGACVIAIAGLAADATAQAASPWRHAYALPVVVGALTLGLIGGTVTALASLMAQAPTLFVRVEAVGLGAGAVDELVSTAVLLILGPLLGSRVTEARRQSERYATILAIQEALGDERPLPELLEALCRLLGDRLAATVTLAVRDGDRWIVAGADAPAGDSAAGCAIVTAGAVFVPDTGHEARPRRRLSTPLSVRGETVGVLTVERLGELTAAERRALVGLALHIGAALENARLAARQRRFADELAEKVRAATDRLATLDRAKSAFVAMASHELRTPLTALVGYSELLATRTFSSDEVRRQAEIMRRQTRRLAAIIDDFLDLSRLERGEAPPVRLADVAVGPALTAAVELLGGPQRATRVIIDCGPEVTGVRADPHALERILMNLLSNALKYSPAHSAVTMRARAASGKVVISVEDAGRGIAPDALPRVFEPYFRAPEAVGRAPGSGLGLAMVKALVEAHHGGVSIESTVGIGTRVTLQLPAVP